VPDFINDPGAFRSLLAVAAVYGIARTFSGMAVVLWDRFLFPRS
jgi:hypothetical protein